jgi:hypothetical protein
MNRINSARLAMATLAAFSALLFGPSLGRAADAFPQVQAFGPDPVVRVASPTRCASRTAVIAPLYSAGGSGGLVRSTLVVDGTRVFTNADPAAPFRLGVRRFKTGLHNYELIGQFSDGRVASLHGQFTRCKSRRR